MILGKMQIPATGTTLKNGLICCLELNEASGTVAYSSNGSNNGTYVGSPTLNASGKLGSAVTFNGTSQYVNFGSYSSFSKNTGSISVWFYFNGTYLTVFAIGGTYRTYLMVDISNSGMSYYTLQYLWRNGGAETRIGAVLGTSPSVGWHHGVVTSNGTSITLYFDGSSKSLNIVGGTNSGNWISDLTSPTYAAIMSYYYGYTRYYRAGTVDQTAIWDRALSAAEVAELYNSGNGLAYSKW